MRGTFDLPGIVMHDKNAAYSIGFRVSLAGALVAGLAAVGLYLSWGTDLAPWLIGLAIPFAFTLEIGGLTAGVFERRAKLRIPGLIVAPIVIVLIIAALAQKLPGSLGMFAFFVWITTPVTAALSGVTAVDVKNRRLSRLVAMVVLWLTPAVFSAWAIVARSGYSTTDSTAEAATGVYSLPFGPWATLAATFGDWPNAGEFFSLPLALVLTIALAVTTTGALKAKHGGLAGILLIVLAAVVLLWFAVGYGQLIACAS